MAKRDITEEISKATIVPNDLWEFEEQMRNYDGRMFHKKEKKREIKNKDKKKGRKNHEPKRNRK